ncbi:SAF domain-containing protein [Ornithinimicrobium murale]|uniref:SAF domain-containing protein n=1 Tax=Ornithinimicrobium murale TaxID=1050153 RepID=UPI001EE0E80B|nr:SAF domain-containing protein [Ornithinimicrobium murale]
MTMAKKKDTQDHPMGGGALPEAEASQAAVGQDPPAPPKLRRRPLMALGGIALVVMGALLAVWAWLATSETSEVLALRNTVMRGESIGAEDLLTVQVGTDPALQSVPGDELELFVGQSASMDMAAGSLLTREAVTSEVVPAAGQSVVGLALGPATMPGEPLQVGDAVRVVGTSGGQNSPDEAAEAVMFEADIVGVVLPGDAVAGQTVVSVLVEEDDAPTIARWAAAGRVALILDSREG